MKKIYAFSLKISCCLFLIIALCARANAQEKTSGADLANLVASKMDTAKLNAALADTTVFSSADPAWIKKKLELDIYHMDHEIRAYQFQYYTSLAIFVMVLVIVGMGLYLSYRQFTLTERLSEKAAKRKPAADGETVAKEPLFTPSTLTLSKDGFTMNTAVIGLMILIISLAFFFLYLNVVYKIDIQ